MRTAVKTDFFAPPRPRVIAHRGFSGDYPENTIPSFQAASETGGGYLELDVHLTRDGEVVVIHDDDMQRVAGVEGFIADMDLDSVRAADAGHNFSVDGVSFPFRGKGIRVPTLREVLSTFSEQRFIIEIKQTTPSIVRPLLEVIEQCAMSRRALVASEHQAPLDEVRVLAPWLPTNFSSHEVGLFMLSLAPGAEPYVSTGDALEIPPEHQSWRLVTPASVAAAHRSGVEVHVWTVNEVAEMHELLALGVDGIITNYPARLLDVIRSV